MLPCSADFGTAAWMFKRLKGLFERAEVSTSPTGRVPAGRRVYAVGDIHGHLDLLDDLLAQIDADHAARPPAERTLIFLGDLVDRGPQSAQVVERLLELSRHDPDARFILGNHEEVMLKALAGEKNALPFFHRIGGDATVMSYGIDADTYRSADYAELLTLMRAAVPEAHVAFLSAFEDLIEIGDYAFVHAGVDPALPFEKQKTETLRWIRQGFLDWKAPLEKIVVHGHTIAPEVEETVCRIGIDTGGYLHGVLTAMGFEEDQRWVLQARAATRPV